MYRVQKAIFMMNRGEPKNYHCYRLPVGTWATLTKGQNG